jgi:hypothetical protein
MATRSIGSGGGRDYATVQAWEDALAGTLTENEIGECYNDSEFTSAATFLTMTGHSGAFDITLRTASGQSFQDHANVRTNALRYNASNGVGFRCTAGSGSYVTMFDLDQARFYMRKLQIDTNANTNIAVDAAGSGTTTPSEFEDILIRTANRRGIDAYGTAAKVTNCVVMFVNTPAGSSELNSGIRIGNGGTILGCTCVVSTDATAGGTGFTAQYSNNILQSSAAFGFSTAAEASGWDTTNSKNNATNLSTGLPGSSNQHSVTFSQTTPFTDADKDSFDLRAIAGTSLIDNGFRDATNGPNDISGTARDSTPTIGAWEVVAVAGGMSLRPAVQTWFGVN